ncbi:MAG: hypothetical protein BWY05_00753 [Euryarchaeota archaeon ADurb.Bin165]|nr:MAG: hypothetical protein BWY05_00753 [Euryarchaeota archaeon ADurb.Bin165]
MFSLITGSVDSDLKHTLLSYDLLGLSHRDTGHLNADIPADAIKSGDNVDFCILGSKTVNLVFKDALYIICRLLGYPWIK